MMVLGILPNTELVSERSKKQMFPVARPLPLEGFQEWEQVLRTTVPGCPVLLVPRGPLAAGPQLHPCPLAGSGQEGARVPGCSQGPRC